MLALSFTAVLASILVSGTQMPASAMDLERASVVCARGISISESNAVRMLVEEAERRMHIEWPVLTAWPPGDAPVIAVGPRDALGEFAGPWSKELESGGSNEAAEGYRLCSKRSSTNSAVFVIGNDARGVLFGCGRLLRELRMGPGHVTVDDDLDISAAPRYALRGHQLGYRPKCNSYDAWDLPQWEQYIRDLAVFGCNAIELIPPRSDDASWSPHFPRPQMEMMTGMSRLADAYGLDVWIWYPAMDRDYSDPKTVESALQEWGKVFSKLPRVDAVFVPGGDPGHTEPKVLMALLEKQTLNLHRYHPKAQMWVSPQSFNQAWLDEFLGILNRERPSWLSGIVYGPQVRIDLKRLRSLVPAQYPIRHYPDITHSRQCQYPVRDWDVAYAVTEARECINPRPKDEAVIFRQTAPCTMGFLSYSEGCNDDVNKIVWSALGWDPDAKVVDILRQYSRYFIGERYGDSFAQGLLALERNWRGPLLANPNVETTLLEFQAMEKSASPADLKNWRFLQGLFRAYYDAYTQKRLVRETELQDEAMDCLRDARRLGANMAIDRAEGMLARASVEPVNRSWRERILELGEALFQSIGMQLSVEKYKAIAVDRGAMLDTLDFPLNDRRWLEARFAKIRKMSSETERLRAIEEIVQWTNPGAGGFYDDLGDISREPHLVRGADFNQDPGGFESARDAFEEDLVFDEPEETAGTPRRMSWIDHAETLYDFPLRVRYKDLDPQARYRLRVVYGGDSPGRKIRLVANGGIEIHPYLAKPRPFRPIEFSIPQSATRHGDLNLSWFGEPGLGRNGRGCQVSEVWLLKEPDGRNR